MPLTYSFSDELKATLKKLSKRDRRRYDIVMKKVEEIINSDEFTIERYKHLRHGFKGRQRVHIDRNFVLSFHYEQAHEHVRFISFDHHDHAYL